MLLRNIENTLFSLIFTTWLMEIGSQDSSPLIIEVPSREIANEIRNISIDGDNFMLNGKPFKILSGSLHYFRVPAAYWRDRLRKLKLAGLNSVATYVEWSFHEPEERQYLFDGDRDVANFVRLAAEEGLYVLLRPGPYICAERDLGGLPYWLLGKYPKISLRSTDKDFLIESRIWMDKLFSHLKPLLYGYGGPIILVQVENEYGSYGADMNYKLRIRDIIRDNVETDALLYTTDGWSPSMIQDGFIPETLTTIDFNVGTNVKQAIKNLRNKMPQGPVMNSEFYPGWLTHWGESLSQVNKNAVIQTLNVMLTMKMSVNFYVFFGGTNFEFSAGANFLDRMYWPDITSYDYDAPLTEAGDPTPKYFAIRDVLLKNNSELKKLDPPSPSPKGKYGKVRVSEYINLLSEEGRRSLSIKYGFHRGQCLPTFESLRQRAGFLLYETVLRKDYNAAILNISAPRDWVNVYVDGEFQGTITRMFKKFTLDINAKAFSILSLLVENQGRINFGSRLHDYKGILSPVTINNEILDGRWEVRGYNLSKIDCERGNIQNGTKYGPVLYKGSFTLPIGQKPLDTFLDPTGWGKGYIWINGNNLGRYWPVMGPQVTLYVPGVWLNPAPESNIIEIVEMIKSPEDLNVDFIEYPILNRLQPKYLG